MKVFMLGWEFPPFISGGLGTACYGLTKAMELLDLDVTFVLPKTVDEEYATHVNLLTPNSLQSKTLTGVNRRLINSSVTDQLRNIRFCTIDSPLQPYDTPSTYHQRIEQILKRKRALSSVEESVTETALAVEDVPAPEGDYSGDMFSEIHRYATIAAQLATEQQFDLIHAHDWMTFPAGMAAAAVTGKPLVVHMHSTEFDRSGEHVNQRIYDIERAGMHTAKKVIAVSYLTRNIILNRYGVGGEKVDVVHNGVDRKGRIHPNANWNLSSAGIEKGEKIVLFLGRITMQKGPEYFLHAAKRVLDVMENVKFVMAGSGDLMNKAVEMSAQLGIGGKVLFTGFLRGDDVQKIYKMADLFVMPSVSEPFGLVPLEALDNDIPVIISRQSGVSEVLKHVLKVDFWDTEEMANKIIAVLKYAPLRITLQSHGNYEVRKLRWKDSAAKCLEIYRQVLNNA